MAEYSKLARGSYTSAAGVSQSINLPFLPGVVRVLNYTSAGTPAANKVVSSYWSSALPIGSSSLQLYNGAATALITSNLSSGGITPYSRALSNQFGPQQQIVSMTKASQSPVVTVTGHGYVAGDVVLFEGLYQSPTTGMPQICGMPFLITSVVDANNFTIGWNTNQSAYTALSGSPTGALVKKILNPNLYSPGVNFIVFITDNGNNTSSAFVTTTTNLVVGSEVSFRIPPQWGCIQLNSNPLIPGSGAFYAKVLSIDSPTSVILDIPSGSYSAYNSNVPVAAVHGLSFPQMVTIGDLNTGGGIPLVSGVPTINGPAVSGAFVNNTCMGFNVGLGIVNAASQLVLWEATAYDYVYNA